MKMKPLGETVTVHDMNIDGTGVARTSGGKVAFVQGAVTGDVRCHKIHTVIRCMPCLGIS